MLGQREPVPTYSDDQEEEIRRLRNALGTEKIKNKRLITVIEKKVLEDQKSSRYQQFNCQSCTQTCLPYHMSSCDPSDSEMGNGETDLSPSVAQSGDQVLLSSRQPTLEECESVIKQLQHKNGQQTHELMQIKADLRDVLYSHKWTPDAYLLARAYVADEREDGKPCDTTGK